MSTEEMQIAFEMSRRERASRPSEIQPLLDAGKHVVVCSTPAYCPRTDGLIGTACHAVGHADTREEAENLLKKLYEQMAGDHDSERDYHILPRISPVAGTQTEDVFEDLPF